MRKTDKKEAVETAKNIQKTKVGIWLNSYEDFYSRFDPRIAAQRALSVDFLRQVKDITGDLKAEAFDMTFLVPKKIRNHTTEKVIKDRLVVFFRQGMRQHEKVKKHLFTRGVIAAALGITLMFFTSMVAYQNDQHYYTTLFLVIFDPTGWFATWYGLDSIFYKSQQENEDLIFYRKMHNSDIRFFSYE